MGMGRGGDQRMDNARLGIHPDMRFHAEVPLIALLRWMHFRITLTLLILGRGRRGDDRRIDNGAFLEDQALHGQQRIDGRKDTLGQLAPFEYPAELQQGGGVGCGLTGQVDANKAADGLTVVDGIFDSLVREPEALLGNVHAQHAFHTHRRASPSFALRVKRLDLGNQRRPRGYCVDLTQKSVAPRHLLLGAILKIRKARLHRQVPINFQCVDSRKLMVTSIHHLANKSACP